MTLIELYCVHLTQINEAKHSSYIVLRLCLYGQRRLWLLRFECRQVQLEAAPSACTIAGVS